MNPLGPLLSIRPSVLDETSPSDLPQSLEAEARSGILALEVGQFIDARIVALEPGGALADLGGALLHLNYPGALAPGQQVRLQVLEKDDQLEFRLLDMFDSEDSTIAELSGALPQLVSPSQNAPGGAEHAPVGWPSSLSSAAVLALPEDQLVQLFENSVRSLLGNSDAASLSTTSGDGSDAGTALQINAASSPGHALLGGSPSQISQTFDPRFLAYVGWAWPEQAIELEVDQRARHAAMSDYMRSCVISMRLHLPRSGRICGSLTSSTAGLAIDLEAEHQDTADRLRQDSGQFLDLLKALEVRVSSMVVRHV